jgi:ABC-2 type transport system permease protein
MTPDTPSFVPGRRYRVAFQVAVGLGSALVILILVNYLAATRLRWRSDLSAMRRFELSPLTRQVLAGLTNDVKVTVFFPRDADLYGHIDGLLREYVELQPKLQVRTVDYLAEPGTALLVRAGYKLGQEEANLVLFDNGAQVIRVAESELSAYDANVNALLQGKQREIRRSGFKGELLFTSALANLALTNAARAAFVVGHDEHRWDSDDQLVGHTYFTRMLAAKAAGVTQQRLDGTNEIPADVQLLVIAGPSQPYLPVEAERVERFLAGGGRVLLTLNSTAPGRNGLEELLRNWGMAAPPIYAADTNQTLGGFSVLATNFASHPVTLPLVRNESSVIFQHPRVVGTLPAEMLPADAPKAQVLLTTGPGGVTKSDLRGGTPSFRPGVDRVGEVPLAAAAERGGVAGVAAGRGNGRLLVVGDAMVFGNAAFNHAGNTDFAELSLAWLLDRTQMLAIGPKPIREYRLFLTERQGRTARWTLLGVLPGSVLALGFFVWFRRRS